MSRSMRTPRRYFWLQDQRAEENLHSIEGILI